MNRTMQLRQLADSWAPTESFSNDGSSSDLALQLYLRYKTGEEISAQLSLNSIPDTVTSRLSDVNVVFDDLDGFAQRAVLWDSGFGVTSTNEVKQIKTLNGLSMAEIALTLEELKATECTAFECTQPDGMTAYNNNHCSGTQMLTGVKCVVEEFEMENGNLAMWSIGGESSVTPEIELVKHTWSIEGNDYIVYAVHTQNSITERKYGGCPGTDVYGYLNIPCYGAELVPPTEEVTEPTPSDWVTSWMATYSSTYVPESSSSSTGSSGSSHSSSNVGENPQDPEDPGNSGSSSEEGQSGTNAGLIGGVLGGGLCLLLVILLIWFFLVGRRRKRAESDTVNTPKDIDRIGMICPYGDDEPRETVSTHPRSTLDDSQPRTGSTLPISSDSWPHLGSRDVLPPHLQHSSQQTPSSTQFPSYNHKQEFIAPPSQEQTRQSAPSPTAQPMSYQDYIRAFGSDAAPPPYEDAIRVKSVSVPVKMEQIRGLGTVNALQILATDSIITRRRIQLERLEVERQLPMTTLQTDSYIANYNGQQVLVKRLAPGQSVNVLAVELLAVEIQQRAHLQHPNLVQFVGSSWTSALDLTMVVEFPSQGTLREYLDRTRMTTWTPQKTSITAGIARALAYLHQQTPAYIYHGLSANNVLLTENFESKLANCGSTDTDASIGAKQRTRQAFWIAPEVLGGSPWSPAADIFSFGVLLSELDTCQTPYFDAKSANGSNLDQEAILALVTEGKLRPSFSSECPNFIRQLGVACCQQDSEQRLTAQQIVQLLL